MQDNSPMRLLYAEDNRLNALLFEEMLRGRTEVELCMAQDGEEAMRIAVDWAPDVLVLDAHLPDLSGFELLHQLRALPGLERVPAYMCSADATRDHIESAARVGFDGCWPKPIDVEMVTAALLALAYDRCSH
jgi:CheY-like chemotaxis protein